MLGQHLARWDLTLDLPPGGQPWAGQCGVVVPVLERTGREAVLKITVPHEEALPEPDALELWEGQGAVRLLRADRSAYVLLLERLDGDTSLAALPLEETTGVWGALVRRLSLVPDERASWAAVPLLATEAETWTDTLPADWELLGRPFPRWLLEHALITCQQRGIVGRRTDADVLVHSDLHYRNILRAAAPHSHKPHEQDGGWKAIDPKPVRGDAEYGVAPMLWNRISELDAADPEAHLRSRCRALADAAGLDPLLARDWSVVREVRNALHYLGGDDQDQAERSLWVASSLLERTLPGLPPAAGLACL
ncbi:aminoglycoside phosphotransferase family protein [Arthrobacter sp. Br18]|uniref:aminoglycoside phosphotransferase family protein n=1 Tax=Arthrobacter sp. Br18 TaxID=1312954 RepID=UPI0020A67018|nr:aminoglycoside phosphotransferase family protein [Arthrobacter sp. Br18]